MFSGLLRSCKRLMNATTWRPNMNQNMTQFHEMSAPQGWQTYDNWKGFENSSEDHEKRSLHWIQWLQMASQQRTSALISMLEIQHGAVGTSGCNTHMLYRTHTKFEKPVNTRWSLRMLKIKLDTLKEICTTVVGTTLLHTSSLNCPCAAFLCEGLYRSLRPRSLIEPRGGTQQNGTHNKKHIWIWKPQQKRLAIVGAVWYFWCHGEIPWNSKLFLRHFEGFRLRIWRHVGSVWSLSDLVAERCTFWCQHA